jgi:hypothetical protein
MPEEYRPEFWDTVDRMLMRPFFTNKQIEPTAAAPCCSTR